MKNYQALLLPSPRILYIDITKMNLLREDLVSFVRFVVSAFTWPQKILLHPNIIVLSLEHLNSTPKHTLLSIGKWLTALIVPWFVFFFLPSGFFCYIHFRKSLPLCHFPWNIKIICSQDQIELTMVSSYCGKSHSWLCISILEVFSGKHYPFPITENVPISFLIKDTAN